jgi:hypothetical protein
VQRRFPLPLALLRRRFPTPLALLLAPLPRQVLRAHHESGDPSILQVNITERKRHELLELKKSLARLKTSLYAAKGQVDHLQRARVALRQQRSAKYDEVQELDVRCSEVEKARRAAISGRRHQEAGRLRTLFEQLDAERDELKREADKLKGELEAGDAEEARTEDRIRRLNDDMKHADKSIEVLQRQLDGGLLSAAPRPPKHAGTRQMLEARERRFAAGSGSYDSLRGARVGRMPLDFETAAATRVQTAVRAHRARGMLQLRREMLSAEAEMRQRDPMLDRRVVRLQSWARGVSVRRTVVRAAEAAAAEAKRREEERMEAQRARERQEEREQRERLRLRERERLGLNVEGKEGGGKGADCGSVAGIGEEMKGSDDAEGGGSKGERARGEEGKNGEVQVDVVQEEGIDQGVGMQGPMRSPNLSPIASPMSAKALGLSHPPRAVRWNVQALCPGEAGEGDGGGGRQQASSLNDAAASAALASPHAPHSPRSDSLAWLPPTVQLLQRHAPKAKGPAVQPLQHSRFPPSDNPHPQPHTPKHPNPRYSLHPIAHIPQAATHALVCGMHGIAIAGHQDSSA